MFSRRSKAVLFSLAGLLALAALVYVVWQRPVGEALNTPTNTAQRPTVSPRPGPRVSPARETNGRSPTRSDPAPVRESSGEDSPMPPVGTTVAEERSIPHDTPFGQIKSELWEDIQANPPELRERGDPLVDAELAYRIYTYYGNCSTSPRTTKAIDRQLEQMAEHAERTAQRAVNTEQLERFDSHVEHIVNQFELCQAIPADVDARHEAVLWMTEAVHLGHEIAQVQFYEKAMGFMVRPDYFGGFPPVVMKNPGLIESFKATARLGLARGMEKGHPEAYLAMSQVLMDGLLYPKDMVMAYAYLRTAEMKASNAHLTLPRAEHQKLRIGQFLTPEEISEAERLALDLWKESND